MDLAGGQWGQNSALYYNGLLVGAGYDGEPLSTIFRLKRRSNSWRKEEKKKLE